MPKEFDVPLHLVTPYMRGQNVRDAQWLMAGNNRWKGLATYKDGKVDGEYGPLSAQATARTKFWLGYPAGKCDQSFGQLLYEYLLPDGDRPLPPDYKTARAARLAATETPGSRALAVAVTQIGTEESPFGSNQQKYGRWYRWNRVPWCAIFDSWCFDQSGYKKFRYASVPTIHADATLMRNNLYVVRSPRPGDLVCYTVKRHRDSHVAFFEKWDEPGESFYDVGGNTGPSNISNGGAVMRQVRQTSMVAAFVRVG